MADQDSPRGSFWSSLPGILTGAAALITAVSGLAIWHNKSPHAPAPRSPALVEQQGTRANPAPTPVATGTQAAPIGSEPWCEEKYSAWKNEKSQTGVDDAALRKEIVQAHCNQFGIKLGRIKGEPSP